MKIKEGIQAKDIIESNIYIGIVSSSYSFIEFRTYKILNIKKEKNSKIGYYFKINTLYVKREEKIDNIDYNKNMMESYAHLYNNNYEYIKLASDIEVRIYNLYKENSIFL